MSRQKKKKIEPDLKEKIEAEIAFDLAGVKEVGLWYAGYEEWQRSEDGIDYFTHLVEEKARKQAESEDPVARKVKIIDFDKWGDIIPQHKYELGHDMEIAWNAKCLLSVMWHDPTIGIKEAVRIAHLKGAEKEGACALTDGRVARWVSRVDWIGAVYRDILDQGMVLMKDDFLAVGHGKRVIDDKNRLYAIKSSLYFWDKTINRPGTQVTVNNNSDMVSYIEALKRDTRAKTY